MKGQNEKNQLFLIAVLVGFYFSGCQSDKKKSESKKIQTEEKATATSEWKSMFTGKNLDGWKIMGKAEWTVENGVLIGQGKNGHIYAAPELTDLEVKGTFRISDQGGESNSGLYFRSNPPADNPESYPKGYEAQICHNQDAHTGWLWKPGTPLSRIAKIPLKKSFKQR